MMSPKVSLITGILGQDGPYLAQLLLEKDYKVYRVNVLNLKTEEFIKSEAVLVRETEDGYQFELWGK